MKEQNAIATVGQSDAGTVTLDPHALVTSRLLVTANSGGGKSYLLRKLIEQIGTSAQTFVLDLEGEFASLRERLDLVIVGPGGEIPADVRSAGLLARRLMEKGISAVIDLSELKFHQRRTFVRVFLEALMELPKSLWHPLFVVIDEAHQFAPEKGHGEAESLQAVRDLCTLGRKRGYCAILATQRISTLDKSCAGECNNKFIGRMTLDLDVKRAAFELGVAPAEALKMLRDLNRGEFHAFGPAIEPRGVTLLKVSKVQTTHPKAGQGQTLKPPRPSSSITAVVGELADLPQQAEAEIKDMAAAKAKIAELQRQVDAKPAAVAPAAKVVEKPVLTDTQLARLEKHYEKTGERVTSIWDRLQGLINPLMELLKAEQAQAGELLAAARSVKAAPQTTLAMSARPTMSAPAAAMKREPRASVLASPAGDGIITGPMQKIIDAYAFWHSIGVERPSRENVAPLAGYSNIRSSGFRNPLYSCNTAGLVVDDALTDEGQKAANWPEDVHDLSSYHKKLTRVMDGPTQKIFDAVRAIGAAVTRDALAEASGYGNVRSSGFRNPLYRLSSMGIVELKGDSVIPTPLMFPSGLKTAR